MISYVTPRPRRDDGCPDHQFLAIPVGSLAGAGGRDRAAPGFGAQRVVQDMLAGFFITGSSTDLVTCR